MVIFRIQYERMFGTAALADIYISIRGSEERFGKLAYFSLKSNIRKLWCDSSIAGAIYSGV